jgi:hypothetical protein
LFSANTDEAPLAITDIAWLPLFFIALTVRFASASFTSLVINFAPYSAKRMAMLSPIPRPDPVTTATLFLSLMSGHPYAFCISNATLWPQPKPDP